MWTQRHTRTLFGLVVLWGGVALLGGPAGDLAHATPADAAAKRELRVSVQRAGSWQAAARLGFDRFYATRTTELVLAAGPRQRGALVRVRLRKHGGGAAHLDAARLAGRAPLAVRGAPLYKLMGPDHDVADVSHGPVELLFYVQPTERAVLTIRARIEPTVIGKTAFRFPRVNTGRPMTPRSAFYSYRLGSRAGGLTVDGELTGESLGTPFFRDAPYVDSGHPQGTTYGWVRDDGQTLYVAVDFTPDNTMDGELDYARVFARVNGRLKTFTVRQSQTRWGRVGFTYTERVGYQHKVYELAIPLRELGNPAAGQLVQLAFAAYGTAGAGAWDTQPMAYEPGSETYLYRFWNFGAARVRVQLFDVLGNAMGTPIEVQTSSGNADPGGVAADPDTGLFLVTWDESSQVHGHLVDPASGLHNTQLLISDNADGTTFNSRPVYDPDLQRYLVIWIDDRTGSDALYGRFLGPDGTAVAASFHIDDMDRQSSSFVPNTPNLVYNTADQELLAVFVRANAVEAQRLDPADGSPLGARITIAAQGVAPSVAYEPASNTYLVAWRTDPVGIPSHMRSRLVYPDGTLEPEAEPMPTSPGIISTGVVGEGESGRFLVVGHDGGGQLVARFVNGSDGALLDTAEFVLNPTGVSCGWAGVATNPDRGHFGPGCLNQSDELPWMTVFPTLSVSPDTVTTDEGGATGTFDVVLLTPPSADVQVLVASSDPAEATVSPATLLFTDTTWDVPQTVTVTGVDDADLDGDAAYTIDLTVDNAASAAEYRYTVLNVAGTNLDDDVAPPVCGDGVLEGAEECDDGNTADGDGCSATCTVEPELCGNGVLDANEECDDGNDVAGDGCHQCLWEPEEDDPKGCGCRAGGAGSHPPVLLLLLIGALLWFRRRRDSFG